MELEGANFSICSVKLFNYIVDCNVSFKVTSNTNATVQRKTAWRAEFESAHGWA